MPKIKTESLSFTVKQENRKRNKTKIIFIDLYSLFFTLTSYFKNDYMKSNRENEFPDRIIYKPHS